MRGRRGVPPRMPKIQVDTHAAIWRALDLAARRNGLTKHEFVNRTLLPALDEGDFTDDERAEITDWYGYDWTPQVKGKNR